ncbi:hypothetical protein KR044_004102 [Drosophila immigrans]|nr:hypothetical protein KR044_004102 [Drosophila immigrans]
MTNSSMRVDLSDFFNDARKIALIFIEESWTNINDVQDHIQKLFHLTQIGLLTKDGCYLSPKESVMVLRFVESVKAFKLSAEEDSGRSSSLLCSSANGKKRKNRSQETEVGFSSSTPNCPKRSKSTNHSDELTLQSAETTKVERQSRKSPRNKSQIPTIVIDYGEDVDLAEISKHSTLPRINNSSRPSCTKSRKETRSQTQSFNVESTPNNHIIYADVDEEETEEVEQQPAEMTAVEITNCRASIAVPQVEFRCQMMELDPNTPRIFEIPRRKETIKILEDIVIPAAASSSTVTATETPVEPLEAQAATVNGSKEAEVPEELPSNGVDEAEIPKELSSIPSANAPPLTDKETLKVDLGSEESLDSDSEDDVMVLDTTLEESNVAECISDMLSNAAPLTDLPNVGETIIFKLSTEKGAPQSSPNTNYIAGTCGYVNRRSKSISISVIAGDVSKTILRGYMTNLEDTSDSTTIVLNVNFRELIEPKVVVSTVD